MDNPEETRALKAAGKQATGPSSAMQLALEFLKHQRPDQWLTSGRAGGLAMIALFVLLRVWDPTPLQTLRGKTFDLYQLMMPRVEQSYPVTIVDIDEQSLAKVGQWPWSRGVLADLVTKLSEAGVAAVGFDVLMAEPDRLSPKRIVGELNIAEEGVRDALASLPDTDESLAKAMARIPTVLGLAGWHKETGNKIDNQTVTFATLGGNPQDRIITFPGHIANVPPLTRAAAGFGAVSVVPDTDGVIRRVPTLVNLENTLTPALPVEMLRIATGTKTILTKSDTAGMRSIVLREAGAEVATDRDGQLWLHFTQHDPKRFVSAADVLLGTASPEKFAGKIAIIGSSAVGLLDLRVTPVERVMPGVEIHAQVIESIMGGALLTRPNYALGAELILAALIGLAIVIAVPMLGAKLTLLLGCLTAAALISGAWWMFATQKTLIDVVYPLVSSLAIFVTLTFANYFREEQRRAQIRTAFRQYLSPALVEQLTREPERLVLGGETRTMSVLFSDVRGFSAIAEGYKENPSGLTALMNRLLTPISNAIIERNGTIDKYIGDAVMAFWNAPLEDPEHANNACKSANEIIQRIKGLNQELASQQAADAGTPTDLKMGIGIATGVAVVGNMGSDIRFDYSVMGDTVNLASRLEGLTTTYGVAILVSAETARTCEADLALLELDRVRVKGKSEPETIFALLGGAELRSDKDFQALKTAFSDVLHAYRSRKWADAQNAIAKCSSNPHAQHIAGPLDLFAERIAHFSRTAPSDDWDGVWTARAKSGAQTAESPQNS